MPALSPDFAKFAVKIPLNKFLFTKNKDLCSKNLKLLS